MAEQRQRVERGDMGEEIALSRGRVNARLCGQGSAIIGPVANKAGIDQQRIELGGSVLGQRAIGRRVGDFGNRWRVAVSYFFEPERGQRAVKLALQQNALHVETVRAQQDVGQIPVIVGLADA